MVATGNVGLAFGLVVAAGAATTLGACVIFCVKLANAKFLAGALGFSAGVMLYVSFAEIFLRKSVDGFVDANYSDVEAYRYSTLAFFAGFVIVFLLDKLVHALIHWISGRNMKCNNSATSQTILLDAEEVPRVTTSEQVEEMQTAACQQRVNKNASTDVEAQMSCVDDNNKEDKIKREEMIAPLPAVLSTSRCIPATCETPTKRVTSEQDPDESENELNENQEISHEERTSRQAPEVINVINQDPHNQALHKMGLLTALAIFLHNFPEGLATFVAALSDTSVGIGIAVAIAVHNIPEGICVALPIYYSTGSKAKAFFWATMSGMSEPLGALVGYFALYGDTSLSFAIVFAIVAGMMVYISIKELIPMALRYDPNDSVATSFVILGMIIMAASLLLFTL